MVDALGGKAPDYQSLNTEDNAVKQPQSPPPEKVPGEPLEQPKVASFLSKFLGKEPAGSVTSAQLTDVTAHSDTPYADHNTFETSKSAESLKQFYRRSSVDSGIGSSTPSSTLSRSNSQESLDEGWEEVDRTRSDTLDSTLALPDEEKTVEDENFSETASLGREDSGIESDDEERAVLRRTLPDRSETTDLRASWRMSLFGRVSVMSEAKIESVAVSNQDANPKERQALGSELSKLEKQLDSEMQKIAKDSSKKEGYETLQGFKLNLGVLRESLNYSETDLKAVKDSYKDVKMRTIAIKGNEFNPIHRIIQDLKIKAIGKAKLIFIQNKFAYFIPTGTDKIKEIREEIQTGKDIRSKLGENEGANLVTDFEIVEGEEQIGKNLTVRTAAAAGDGENLVREGKVTFPQSLILAMQFMTGLKDLHKAGYIHGDLKLENLLIYKDPDGNSTVKISDFGKTKPIGDQEERLHSGNTRHVAPEGRISKKGEVFSAHMIIVRFLEGELIGKGGMLIDDNQAASQGIKDIEGYEKFMVNNTLTAQSDNMMGRVKDLARPFSFSSLKKNDNPLDQQQAHKYISALMDGLQNKYDLSDEQIAPLKNLLNDMAKTNPEERPTAAEALERMSIIVKPFI